MLRKIDNLKKNSVYGNVQFIELIEDARPYYAGGRKYFKAVAVCSCTKCYKVFQTDPYRVINGDLKSCGCQQFGKSTLSHGMTNSKTHNIWMGMRKRCKDKLNKNYGARGIKVCKRWHNFNNFLDDMGECPEGYSIERIDNNKNYNKYNCKWIEIKRQPKNRRDTISFVYKNKKYDCLKDFCRDFDIGYAFAYRHYKKLNESLFEIIKKYRNLNYKTGFIDN